jgi:hypothetical protein
MPSVFDLLGHDHDEVRQVAAFFDGLGLLEPGLVNAGLWRTTQAEPAGRGFLAGAGRKR